jgi:hypothetical protein
MRIVFRYLLVIACLAPAACGAGQSGSPDTRAARAAVREWLQRTPEFAAKTGKEPGSLIRKDHDHAVVLVTASPPGSLQGVIRLTRIDGGWQVRSATTRPQPRRENIVSVMFRFDYTPDGRAGHIELHRCTGENRTDATGALTRDEIARAAKIIASRHYNPPERSHQKAYDFVLFDKAARQFLLD